MGRPKNSLFQEAGLSWTGGGRAGRAGQGGLWGHFPLSAVGPVLDPEPQARCLLPAATICAAAVSGLQTQEAPAFHAWGCWPGGAGPEGAVAMGQLSGPPRTAPRSPQHPHHSQHVSDLSKGERQSAQDSGCSVDPTGRARCGTAGPRPPQTAAPARPPRPGTLPSPQSPPPVLAPQPPGGGRGLSRAGGGWSPFRATAWPGLGDGPHPGEGPGICPGATTPPATPPRSHLLPGAGIASLEISNHELVISGSVTKCSDNTGPLAPEDRSGFFTSPTDEYVTSALKYTYLSPRTNLSHKVDRRLNV